MAETGQQGAGTTVPAATQGSKPSTGQSKAGEHSDQQRQALRPPVDVVEDATGITLYADMPGVSKENLQLRLEGEQLTIEGEMTLALPEQMSASHAEVETSHFRRTFALSKELDAENIEAECRNGVLTLRIPKAKHAQPRKIEISVA